MAVMMVHTDSMRPPTHGPEETYHSHNSYTSRFRQLAQTISGVRSPECSRASGWIDSGDCCAVEADGQQPQARQARERQA
jgi:hypothetical protein